MPSSRKGLEHADSARSILRSQGASGRARGLRPDLAGLVAAMLAACSVELAPLVADPPDASANGGKPAFEGGVAGFSAAAGAGAEASLGGAPAGGGSGSSGDSGSAASGAGASAGDSGGSGSSGTGATGGAASFECELTGPCEFPDLTYCECNGCWPECVSELYVSDCLCPSCAPEPDCNFCDYNGKCNPIAEGCGCVDCVSLCGG